MNSIPLREVLTEAQAGIACGVRTGDGIVQLRLNNILTNGALCFSDRIRIPKKYVNPDFNLLPSDVIFCNTNSVELVGKTAIFESHKEPVTFSNHLTRLRTDKSRLMPEYLALWLQHVWRIGIFASICDRWIGQAAVQRKKLEALEIPLPPVEEQRRIAAQLKAQLAAVEEARQAAQNQIGELTNLANAVIRESLAHPETETVLLGDVLEEVKHGIGREWADYPVLGATRSGLAPAKEPVGKYPERYKPVFTGTVFYNPMRILIGSIAMVDDNDAPGITSPDYVALRGRTGLVDSRWFYYWLRSPPGEHCIASLARGAVRERMLFNRLAEGEAALPPFAAQLKASRMLAEIQPMKAHVEARLREIELLPARLLAQAFGEA